MEKARREAGEAFQTILVFCKWTLLALLIGALGGLLGSVFHISVEKATALREEHGWLIFLLPAAGLAIAGVYRVLRAENRNTNTVIDSVCKGERVPAALGPAIFLTTGLTHLFGGSAGREGAALQIGGCLGNALGRGFRLDDRDLRLATLAGMSAVFSALFGTPLAAAVFVLEVATVGVMYYSALVPCLASALIAKWISAVFQIEPVRFALPEAALPAGVALRVAGLAVLCALLSIAFCEGMHGTERLLKRLLPNAYARAAAGGAAVVGLTLLLRTREFNGAGMESIRLAVEEGFARPDAFFWKLLFTAVTLGAGFKGGEVVPSFFVGATFGCAVGALFGLPAGFAAAIGLVAVFCGAVNCPMASILLSVELFGPDHIAYFALACAIAYMLSGNFSLYSSQKILYSKRGTQFFDTGA